MSSARNDRLRSSTSCRLSAIYAGLLVLAFVAAAIVSWYATQSAAEAQVRIRIQLEMTALQAEFRAEGMPAAIAAIKSRQESPGALEYHLTDAAGRTIVGDPQISVATTGWRLSMLHDRRSGEDEFEEFLLLTAITPDGNVLTIGDDLDQAKRVRDAVLEALLGVAAATLLVVLGAGVLLAQRSAKRMRALSDAMDRVGRGDFSARAPERGDDEVTRIGRGVNDMLGQINRLVTSIRRVSTDIAHDLRTPLAHVRQELETAASSGDPAAAQAGIRAAQTRIDDILRIFQAMLRLAEIDAGGAKARFGAVDLAAIVERVTDAYRGDIEAAGRRLDVAPMLPTSIHGDADLIAQALANLLENAMRHTPAGSPIHVRLTDEAGLPLLEVADEGPGIPVRERDRVLEPFVRVDPSRTSGGAGLGLSIVSAIARLHGATLRLVDARPGLRVQLAWAGSSAD